MRILQIHRVGSSCTNFAGQEREKKTNQNVANMWWRKWQLVSNKKCKDPALFIFHHASIIIIIIIIIIVPSSKQPKQERYWSDSDVCFFPGQPEAGSSVPICWNFILPLPKRPRLFGNPGEVNRQVTTGSKVVQHTELEHTPSNLYQQNIKGFLL